MMSSRRIADEPTTVILNQRLTRFLKEEAHAAAKRSTRLGGIMTPERQQMIEDTWRALEPTATRFVEVAVQHLLEVAPESRSMFDRARITDHYSDIAHAIGDLVGALDEPKRFVPVAVRIGRDNADSGIDTRLYSSFGDALIWALHQHLGYSFTLEIQKAWVEGHRLAAAIMQRAAQARTGEFERLRTDEFAAFQLAISQNIDSK